MNKMEERDEETPIDCTTCRKRLNEQVTPCRATKACRSARKQHCVKCCPNK